MTRIWLAPLLLVANATAFAEPAQRYVMGSYVNVREQPSRNANVIDHLVVNTPVTLHSQSENYCEINWGSDKHGFVVCDLIGEKLLRLEDIDTNPTIQVPNPQYKPAFQQQILSQILDQARYGTSRQPQPQAPTISPVIDQPNPHYSPLRAFWLEPTIKRLFDAGKYFEQIALPADQLDEEEKFGGGETVPELKRPPLPEFEAMKKSMADGLIAPRSQYASPTAWKRIQAIIENPDAPYVEMARDKFDRITPHLWLRAPLDYILMFEKVSLPKSKPSFFKSVDEIGRPSASAEVLSAQYQIPHRVIVLDKPMWGGDNNSYPILMGAWDIGKVESRLTRPVYEVAIGIDGEISIGETEAPTTSLRGEDRCDGSFELGTSKKLLPGYEQIQQPWIFFRLATIPALTKAKVVISKNLNEELQNEEAADISKAKRKVKIEKIHDINELQGSTSNARIDLDADGIDDLFVWDDGGNGVDDLGYERKRLIFANVSGQWYLLDTDDEHACGC